MEKFTFRRARPSDVEAVRNIRQNVYDGLDIYPYMFPQYVRDPHRHIYVALIDDRVVSTGCLVKICITLHLAPHTSPCIRYSMQTFDYQCYIV